MRLRKGIGCGMFDVVAIGLIYMISRYGHNETKTSALRLDPHYLLFVLHPTTEIGRAKRKSFNLPTRRGHTEY